MNIAPRNVTRAYLVDLTRERTGLSREQSRKVVETILQIVEDNLRAGGKVKVSSFGTFTVKQKHSRRGRDLKTGVPVTIDSRRVLSFKASQILKDLVAETEGRTKTLMVNLPEGEREEAGKGNQRIRWAG
jgi:integration host factor subunit alpha